MDTGFETRDMDMEIKKNNNKNNGVQNSNDTGQIMNTLDKYGKFNCNLVLLIESEGFTFVEQKKCQHVFSLLPFNHLLNTKSNPCTL